MSAFKTMTQGEKRLFAVKLVILFCALIVEGRLVYLQVIKHSEFREMADRQQFTPKDVQASRGLIEDRNESPLAVNVDLFNVCAHPDLITDKVTTAKILSQSLGMSYGEVMSKLSSNKSFVWLARQVPYERSTAVESLKLQGVEAFREQRRFYPDHEMASHVVGFAGIDNQGLDGLERLYDSTLKGKTGKLMAERDARGRLVIADNKKISAGTDGLNVVTTLDKTLQHIAQVELEKAYDKYKCKAASIIVMDPHTGELLAVANYPNFDPNYFKNYGKEIWSDRAVGDSFEPGSTFKLVTMAAALENGVVSEDDKFFCENGHFLTDYGRVVTDHEKFGWLTVREIFGYSSNIGTTKVAMKLGKDQLYAWIKKFGFGDLTGVDLPGEASGMIRPVAKWSGTSITTIPYGYEVSTTPLQILDAYAAIANGGVMMKPYIVQRMETIDGKEVKEFGPKKIRRVCSAKTAARMTDMMRWVVQKGTGTAVALPNYDIAGKTGTAYKFMGKQYSKYNYVSSFVGFVPAQNPKLAIYVSLDDPRGLYWGGYTAGPVFKEVAKRAMAYDLIAPIDVASAPMTAPQAKIVPAFTGLTEAQCQWLADQSGLKLKFAGKGERVTAQSVNAGSDLTSAPQDKLILTLGADSTPSAAANASGVPSGTEVMPDLRGKTKRQALALVAPLGLKVNFKGQGVVESQFPLPGRLVNADGLCEMNCDLPLTDSQTAPAPGGHS
jgi:cell division protein FtsI (penicillin-binding protein 3)